MRALKLFAALVFSILTVSAIAGPLAKPPVYPENTPPEMCQFTSTTNERIIAPCKFNNMKMVGKVDMSKMIHNTYVTPTSLPASATNTKH